MEDFVAVEQAAEHDLREGEGESLPGLVEPDAVERDFADDVQAPLDIRVLHAAEVLAEVHVEEPMHGLDRPFQAGVAEEILGGELAARDVVAPFESRQAPRRGR